MIKNTLIRFVKEEEGATAIEYGLIAALVSVAGIVALQAMGGSLSSMFSYVATKLGEAVTSSGATGTGG